MQEQELTQEAKEIKAQMPKPILISDLRFDNPKQQQKLSQLLQKADSEVKETNKISKEIEADLNQLLPSILLKTVKEGGEQGLSKIADGVSQCKPARLFFSYQGMLFTFGMNVALSDEGSVAGVLKDAAYSSASDCIIGWGISRVAGAAVEPIDWTLLGIDMADSVCYGASQPLKDLALERTRRAFEMSRSDPLIVIVAT